MFLKSFDMNAGIGNSEVGHRDANTVAVIWTVESVITAYRVCVCVWEGLKGQNIDYVVFEWSLDDLT